MSKIDKSRALALVRSIQEGTTTGFSEFPAGNRDSGTTGFMVGGAGPVYRPVTLDLTDEWAERRADEVVALAEYAAGLGSAYAVGGWLDVDSGRFYLEVSREYHGLFEAVTAARATGELAIYDLMADRPVRMVQ